MSTPVQAVFLRDMLFDLASVVDSQVITAANQKQGDIDNAQWNDRRVTHDYLVGGQVYVDMIGIYQKLDNNKQGTYIIT